MAEQKLGILPRSGTRWRGLLLGALAVLALAALAVFLQIRWSPANSEIHVDGTIFAYAGARILEGDIPYRDFWDHKPPGVFYLNALAFWLWGTDAWSVWFLAVVWTIALAWCFYGFLRRMMRRAYAFLGTVVLLGMVLQPRFYEEPNLTEFYGLVPVVLSLLFAHEFLVRRRRIALLAFGGALSAAAVLKHTSVATPLACLAVMTWVSVRRKGWWAGLREMLPILVGPVVVCGLIALYWGSQGALEDLWQATIEYNVLLTRSWWTLRHLYGSARSLAADTSAGPLVVLSVGAVIDMGRTRRKRGGQPASVEALHWAEGVRQTYAACLFALIVEVTTVSLAGQIFNHYYMSVLPALCAGASYWLARPPESDTAPHRRGVPPSGLPPLAMAGMLAWLLVSFGLVRPSLDDLRSFVLAAPVRRPQQTNVGRFVESETAPTDTVLVWGIGAEVNFETGRKAPSRYVYALPLFIQGFQNRDRWQEFLVDLESNRPALIIAKWGRADVPGFDAPLEDLASRCDCSGDILAGFRTFAEYVAANYERELMFDESFAFYWRRNR